MKKFLYVFCVLSAGLCLSQDSHAARPEKLNRAFAACPNVQTINGNFIYKNAAPLRTGGVGTPLIGFQEVPTLIMKRNVSSRGRATMYDKNGGALGSTSWRSAHDFAGGRFKFATNTRSMRRTAVKRTRSAIGLIKINGRTCIQISDIGGCYGSSKGKCNQVLK